MWSLTDCKVNGKLKISWSAFKDVNSDKKAHAAHGHVPSLSTADWCVKRLIFEITDNKFHKQNHILNQTVCEELCYSLSPPQRTVLTKHRSFSICTSPVLWSAHVTHWCGTWRWTGACLTETQGRTHFWERRSSTHTRYVSTQDDLRVSSLWECAHVAVSLSLQAYYYSAIVEDVFLRFSWVLTICLSTLTDYRSISDILATVLAPLEVFRYTTLSFTSTPVSITDLLLILRLELLSISKVKNKNKARRKLKYITITVCPSQAFRMELFPLGKRAPE